MIYRESEVPEVMRTVAMCAWEFILEEGDRTVAKHQVPPDGTTNLVLVRTPVGEFFPSVVGPSLVAVTVPIQWGCRYVGLRLRPEAAWVFTGRTAAVGTVEPSAIDGQLAHVWLGLGRLADGSNGWAETSKFVGTLERTNRTVAAAVDRLVESGGNLSISGIASELDLSERQLRRRFRAACGVSPKQFADVQRIRRALICSLQDVRWAEIAHNGGFADQSHLIRSVKTYFGGSPSRISGVIGGIRHEFLDSTLL